MRTPTWDEFREFLRHDDWDEDRSTGHDFFEKTLPDGEILRTRASRSLQLSMRPVLWLLGLPMRLQVRRPPAELTPR